VPLYEYYCHNCDTKFELLRPMSQSTSTAVCPTGHKGAKRAVSAFAAIGRGEEGFGEADFGDMPSIGGGCGGCAGGACACSAGH
jgi:putative FmdB family regulatory protein